ncbi:MAG: hypothetical protein ABIV94_02295 [Acidimicrobiales bacterium]
MIEAVPRVDPRVPAGLAIGSGLLALIGVYTTWLRVTVAGFSGPGGTQSGWDGRDGWTVAVTAAVAAAAGLALLIGRREAWVPNLLILTGGITVVIAAVNVAGASAKADDIHLRYDIAASDVSAHVGVGLWLVALAGAGILAGALLAHQVRR